MRKVQFSLGSFSPSPMKIHSSSRKFFQLGNLGFSLGRESAFLLKELGPLCGKIHYSLGTLSFSPKNFSYYTRNLFGTCSLLFLGEDAS